MIEHLVQPTVADIAEILTMFRRIKGRTCSARAYLDYLDASWDQSALFVCRIDGHLVGYTHAVKPSLPEPLIGYLPFSYSGPKCGHQNALEAMRMAEEWLRAQGAKTVRMQSVRNAKAMQKSFGFKLSPEQLFDKGL